ncbi:MAG: nuclear transport factor 2 family protein [Steroidobacteraceae bacterium]
MNFSASKFVSTFTLAITWLASGCAQQPDPQAAATAAAQTAEIASLRNELADAKAQNAIRGLMHAYGRLIDARDWDGFAKIWTDDAVYVGGPGSDTLKGGPAISDFLRRIITSNPSGVGEPNFHVFFNEEIEVSGDQAKATSMSTFVTPGPTGAPTLVILARYQDEYVLTGGQWRFKGRVVQSNLPKPRPKAK